ncbi:glutathione transferase GstA [Tistrella sp. BH-R2-4]|uniref:Glutathione transferase GstA n=1 Tax=Tistrella arctica TaxID=3133430 RepID=A0ABU9YEJ3_9PROT
MLLYFKPGACSLASRITLTEIGRDFDAIKVDTETATTAIGADYLTVNPKGYVPALEIEPGVILTENAAILQYLADIAPDAAIAPAAGTIERVRLQEWLNFIASELHKSFSPWFSGRTLEDDEMSRAEATLFRRIGDVERALSDGRPFILGQTFTVADAYLFVVLNWSNFISVDLARWPMVAAYVGRVGSRPAVRRALIAEGLIQSEAA